MKDLVNITYKEKNMKKPEEKFPLIYAERMQQLLGSETPAFFHAMEEESVRGLRVNKLKKHGGSGIADFFSLEEIPWCPNGYYYRQEEEPGRHPLQETGAYYIQEPSAMAPVMFLSPEPGERVLDLCAAPGGKSTQIAERLGGEGILIANEPVEKRAAALSENMERMGVTNSAVTVETPERLAGFFPEWFDRILVDAPCSGEGMFRRNPAAIGEWSPDNVRLCAERQRMILGSAVRMLSPGGRLVYSTCTFSREEDEENVTWLLKEYPFLHPAQQAGEPFLVKACGGEVPGFKSCFRLMPHRIRGEGHFAAVFEKDGERPGRTESDPGEKRPGRAEKVLLAEFCRDTLTKSFDERNLILHGTELFLAGGGFPDLRGLRILRQGLHLGSFKKGRFEPAHALALSLGHGDTLRRSELTTEEARKWICGETLPFEGKKGWILISTGGYSLGWGKCDGRLLKNHYPKGLRRTL